MTNGEYQAAQDQCVGLAQLALLLPDLDEMLRQIDHANAVGPILDPSLWMRGNRQLDQVRELVVACRDLKAVAERHAEVLHG